jgi:hypothetical protein
LPNIFRFFYKFKTFSKLKSRLERNESLQINKPSKAKALPLPTKVPTDFSIRLNHLPKNVKIKS